MNPDEAYIRMARVLHEDERYVTLEVAKDPESSVYVNRGDRFLSILFQANAGPWLPWEES